MQASIGSVHGLLPPGEVRQAAFLARMLIAASDGPRIQWLRDPSIDLESDLGRLGEALGVTRPTAGASTADG